MRGELLRKSKADDPLAKLGGTALKVYIYLLTRSGEPVGVRELQRALGFKSPSTAKHHLDRLVELGLAKKIPGGEYVATPVKGSIFSLFLRFYGKFIPRILPASAAALAVLTADIVLNGLRDPPVMIALLALSVVSIIESIRMLRWLKSLRSR